MKISRIHITNFRLLKDFSIDLEDDLSLVIGKNNTGKTSLLTALDRFLNPTESRKLCYDDFNTALKDQIESFLTGTLPSETSYSPAGVKVRIEIEYDDEDDLSSVSTLIMSLDPSDRHIVVELAYELGFNELKELKEKYDEKKDKYGSDVNQFLKEHVSKYFGSIKKKSVSYTDPGQFVDLDAAKISLSDVIGFRYISAKRDVTNKDSDKTLSGQTSKIYKNTSESKEQEQVVEKFKDTLRVTDKSLSGIYDTMFKGLIKKIKRFGGLKNNETLINIASTLQHKVLLDGNTTVFYTHEDRDLPEYYNGLGYMNLISMIFDIEVLVNELKRPQDKKPAAINILFIEEPEAHTHPQMQYVFINNIKDLLRQSITRTDGSAINLQTVITTHSSHIVAESNFDEIKYLRKLSPSSVESRNLKSLEQDYSDSEAEQQRFKFLKQYLTLNRAELFFADKIILVEGETERILLPAMMKKFDQESASEDETPLLSQNVSIVEVGAHSQVFEKFINFIGSKTLVITDMDTAYKEEAKTELGQNLKSVKCCPNDPKAQYTANASLQFFHGKQRTDLSYFLALDLAGKCLAKKAGSWVCDTEGNLLIVYQTWEDDYHGRSFEDAFFSLNKQLLEEKTHTGFPSLTKKWLDKYLNSECDAREFSEQAVNSKPTLAIEILLNSERDEPTGKEFANWKTPSYIKEGLEWLQQN